MKKYSAILPLVLTLSFLACPSLAAAQQNGTRSAGLVRLAKLTPSDGRLDFGSSLAFTDDVVVVGADGGGFAPGTIYLYLKPAGGWSDMTETAQLTPAENNPGDRFGSTVSISGNTIVVGAPFADYSGVAYIFVRPATGWVSTQQETAKLTPEIAAIAGSHPDSAGVLYFGEPIAISGHTLAVGGIGWDQYASPDGGSEEYGLGFVYREPPGGWRDMRQTATFYPSGFGVGFTSLAIDGNTIVGGVAGHKKGTGTADVYTYTPGSSWKLAAKLTPADAGFHDAVGQSVAIRGDTVLVGSPQTNNPNHGGTGKAYVFVEPATGWANTSLPDAKLTPSDGAVGDSFGSAVSLTSNTAIIGLPNNLGVGALYAFVEPVSGWNSTGRFNSKITSPEGITGFGAPLAAASHTIVVDSPNEPAVYVFGNPQ
jgi:hypothetical protein